MEKQVNKIKFGQQLDLILRVPLGTPHQVVVMALFHNHVTLKNLFISSYRGANVIKSGH